MREGRVVGLKCRTGGTVERGKGKKKEREDTRGSVEEKEGKENEWWRIKRVKEYKNKKKKKLLGSWATACRLCLTGDVG